MFSLRQELKFHGLFNLNEGRQATTTQTGRKESDFTYTKILCILYYVFCNSVLPSVEILLLSFALLICTN